MVSYFKIYKGKKLVLKKTKFCDSFFSRLKGLMFSRPLKKGEGILIPFKNESKLNSLHMFFVFFPIDIIWLDKKLKVKGVKRNALPFTPILFPKTTASFALETPREAISVKVGDSFKFAPNLPTQSI